MKLYKNRTTGRIVVAAIWNPPMIEHFPKVTIDDAGGGVIRYAQHSAELLVTGGKNMPILRGQVAVRVHADGGDRARGKPIRVMTEKAFCDMYEHVPHQAPRKRGAK